MKKLSILIVVLLMVSMVAMPVLAAQDASMTLSASKTNLEPGDTFTVTVSTTKVENCKTGGFMFQFDENVFEYVDGSALVSGFAMSGISTLNGNVAGYFMSITGGATVKGELFRITLKVKDTASAGSYTITGVPSLAEADKESVSAIAGSVTVKVGTTQTEPTESETVAATTEPVETPTTEATETKDTEATTEATTQATTEATAEVIEPSKDTEVTTQPTEIITIGAITPAEEKAGFPWWIPFALLGIGSIIAIIVIKKKS